MLSLARPIRIENPDCLSCHSTRSAAPAVMLATYGRNNRFGWPLHEVVAAQVVPVSMDLPLEKAHETFLMSIAILLGVFVPIISSLTCCCTTR
jgi:hypothetical protein